MGGTTQLNITTATIVQTNFVEWIVDPSGSTNDTVVSTPTLSNFNHLDVYYQSGIGYFASRPSASFEYSASNFYRNVYQDGDAISFPTVTNCSVTTITVTGSGITGFVSSSAVASMPLLNSSSNCHLTDLQVTGNVLFNDLTSISGAYGTNTFTHYDITVDGQVLHPYKTDRTTSQLSKTSFMVYSGSIGSTNLTNNEYFNTENYRIVSGNYVNQAALTSSSNTWNPQTHMNAANAHGDGMVSVSGYLISPTKIGNLGDTRNVAQGGSLQAPTGNPNYSSGGLTDSTRTYYRLFRYTGGSPTPNITLTLYGDATLVAIDATSPYYAALGANKNCTVEFRASYDPDASPDQSTTWCDAGKIVVGAENNQTDIGAGIRTGAATGEDVTIDGGGLALTLSLGSSRLISNQYYVLKISAHKSWTGYISRIQVAYG